MGIIVSLYSIYKLYFDGESGVQVEDDSEEGEAGVGGVEQDFEYS